MKPKVYLAGGFKSGWQHDVINNIHMDVDFFNPAAQLYTHPVMYTENDIRAIGESDYMFAYLEKDNPVGYCLAFEIGLAYARGTPIILVTDKDDPRTEKGLEMLQVTANLSTTNMSEAVAFLQETIMYDEEIR